MSAKNVVFILSLLFPVFLSPLTASADPGPVFTKPEINERGEIVIFSRDDEFRLHLRTVDPWSGKTESREISLGPRAGLPKLKKDGRGRVWAAWPEEDGPGVRIALGTLDDLPYPRLRMPSRISAELPWDFALDETGDAWLAWVEDKGGGRSVRAESAAAGSARTISSFSEEINALSLLCDSAGVAWAFWTAVTPRREQIFSSTHNGRAWSEELLMTPGRETPSITPRVAAGRDGTLWLVWSGYNGRKYEILARTWNGRSWSPARALTGNSGANDVFPSVELAFGTLPVVSWVRFTSEGRSEWTRCGTPGGWQAEDRWPSSAGRQPFVPVAVSGDRAFLLREEHGSVRAEVRFLFTDQEHPAGTPSPLGRPDRLPELNRVLLPDFIYNPSLKENVYIALGDSITYGICDENGYDDPTDYIPEKSYPPRLEALLSDRFGPHQVKNEGVPGESTIQGLARLSSVLAAYQARYILILEGTNDIIWNDYSLDTTIFNLREMLRLSLEYGLLPALATCIPKFGRNAFPARLDGLNARIRLLAAERPVPLVDLNRDFAEYPESDGGAQSLYCWGEDRTHPNEKGYQFMAEKWFEAIRRFPFPPGDFRVRRAYDDILFYRAEGNYLEWSDNPKILDAGQIGEYRVYRKKASESPSAFSLLSSVAGRQSYFDTSIQSGVVYTYVVSTVLSDNMEGPSTPPLNQ